MAVLYHGVPTVDETGDQAMTTLYQQWYNAVTTGLRLDPGTFQLIQANLPVGGDEQLWGHFNAIPPPSLVANPQLNGLHRRYDEYRAVVGMLRSAAPGDPIAQAQQAVHDQAAFSAGMPAFSATMADLRAAIGSAPGAMLAFDSTTQSTDCSASWAPGVVGACWDFFAADGSGEWLKTQSKAASGPLRIALSMQHVLPFPAWPGSWYSAVALSAAYTTRDGSLWRAGTPNWHTAFGPTGSMQRFLAELLVADGITLTMTSAADYDTGEQEAIAAHLDAGCFPLYSPRGSGGYASTCSFDSAGTMTMTATSPPGNPVVIGAVVRPAAAVLGGTMTTARAAGAARRGR